MNSFDVIKTIISNNNLEKCLFSIYPHDAVKNWRQINSTIDEKINNINSGIQFDIYNLNNISGKTILNLHDLNGFVRSECPLISFASKFIKNEKSLHISMMNLHLGNNFTFDKLINSLHFMIKDKFWLLKTDRFYHVYSDNLLNQNEWFKWNLQFLMTDCLVSPRYIGHSLERNFNLLRQNATSYIKTKIPTVVYNSN